MTDVDTAEPTPLLAAHAEVHRQLEESAWLLVEALVRVDLDAARAHFARFQSLLAEHMALEDERVLPAYRTIAPAEGPGRLDHVEGDHTILLRHTDTLASLLDELADHQPLTLRAVLQQLPVCYRLLGTLEHHTAREQRHVYPALEQSLSLPDQEALTVALSALVARSPSP